MCNPVLGRFARLVMAKPNHIVYYNGIGGVGGRTIRSVYTLVHNN